MTAPPPAASSPRRTALRWLRRAALLVAVLVALHLDLRSWDAAVGWLTDRADAVQPLHSGGAPLRVADGGQDRVYLLTTRQQTRRGERLGVRTLPAGDEVQLDLWAFDAAAARPLWRRRILAGTPAALSGHRLLGAAGGRLWLYADGLRAVALADGAPATDPDDLQRRNAAVAGLLPTDASRYGFDGGGVYLVDDVARRWWLDAADLRLHAEPPPAPAAPARPGVVAPAWFQAYSTDAFKARGLDLDQRWLGLLDPDEARRLAAPPQVPGAKPGERPGAAAHHYARLHTPNQIGTLGRQRYRLWRARIVQVSAAPPGWPKSLPDNWGSHDQYRDFEALPRAPEFLDAGLLAAGQDRAPILLQEPDSVLVLHRDRLGAGGRLRLARVAGPDGEVGWNAALPLSVLQAVMPGERSLVLFGRSAIAGADADTVSEGDDPPAVLATVGLADGQVAWFVLDGAAAAATAIEPPPAL